MNDIFIIDDNVLSYALISTYMQPHVEQFSTFFI